MSAVCPHFPPLVFPNELRLSFYKKLTIIERDSYVTTDKSSYKTAVFYFCLVIMGYKVLVFFHFSLYTTTTTNKYI